MTTEEKPVEARQLTFKMGDPVPDWLLTLEPAMADAVRGEVTFNVGCDVFDLPAVYVLMPRVVGNYTGLLNITGMGNKLYATGKDVRVCISSQVIAGDVFQEANGPVASPARPASSPMSAVMEAQKRAETFYRQRTLGETPPPASPCLPPDHLLPSAEQVSRKRGVLPVLYLVLQIVGALAVVAGVAELFRHLST